MPWHPVCNIADIAPGNCFRAEVDDEDIILVNLDGDLYACANICTHDYAVLHEGELEGEELICPLHLARFDVRTGEALCAPAYEALQTYPVRLLDDGKVELELDD
ncbi:MAG: 3-phenylpropionate/trans-cinnamate dioxygenase ferredoxin subunit [Gammaproteobacteria bacterium]|jgi:3-phenylpropionate/trans-cinnamate dioxygenase ferredoxin subunit